MGVVSLADKLKECLKTLKISYLCYLQQYITFGEGGVLANTYLLVAFTEIWVKKDMNYENRYFYANK